jgi:hypothetical protein
MRPVARLCIERHTRSRNFKCVAAPTANAANSEKSLGGSRISLRLPLCLPIKTHNAVIEVRKQLQSKTYTRESSELAKKMWARIRAAAGACGSSRTSMSIAQTGELLALKYSIAGFFERLLPPP